MTDEISNQSQMPPNPAQPATSNQVQVQPVYAPPTEPVTVAPTQPVYNPLLDRVRMPGETFRLPSGGLFYKNGELSADVKDGEVQVLPMTGIDEIMIKTPDLLYSGKAVEEVFRRCIPQIMKPTELLARDVDFLLICLRKVSFGVELELKASHSCKGAKDHSYVVSMDTFIRESKQIDPTSVASNYSVELENGQVVSLQPIRYMNFVEMMQINDKDHVTPEDIRDIMFRTLSSVIVAVDDITDKFMIGQWLDLLPAGWLHKINAQVEKTVDWGPSFDAEVKCKDCGKPMIVTAPLNPVAFFM